MCEICLHIVQKKRGRKAEKIYMCLKKEKEEVSLKRRNKRGKTGREIERAKRGERKRKAVC